MGEEADSRSSATVLRRARGLSRRWIAWMPSRAIASTAAPCLSMKPCATSPPRAAPRSIHVWWRPSWTPAPTLSRRPARRAGPNEGSERLAWDTGPAGPRPRDLRPRRLRKNRFLLVVCQGASIAAVSDLHRVSGGQSAVRTCRRHVCRGADCFDGFVCGDEGPRAPLRRRCRWCIANGQDRKRIAPPALEARS